MPTFYRLLLSGGRLDRKLGARLVDAILEGFRRGAKALRDEASNA